MLDPSCTQFIASHGPACPVWVVACHASGLFRGPMCFLCCMAQITSATLRDVFHALHAGSSSRPGHGRLCCGVALRFRRWVGEWRGILEKG